MKQIVMMLALGLCCGFASSAKAQPGAPELCLAKMDAKEQVHIRCFIVGRLTESKTTGMRKNDKGELVPIEVKVGRASHEEFMMSLPLKAVKGFDVEGKPLDRKRLAEILAKESPVVVIVGEPNPKELTLFKADLAVLSLPMPVNPYLPRKPEAILPEK